MKNSLIRHAIAVIGAAALAFLAASCGTWPAESIKGDNAYKGRNWDADIASAEQKIRDNPNSGYGYTLRGVAYYYKGEYQLAVADFETADRLDSDFLTMSNLAKAKRRLAQSGRQNTPATPASTPATTASARAAYNRGDTAYYQRNLDQAIVEFTEAIRLDPNFAAAYNGRGQAYYYKGDYDRAIVDYEAAIRLGYSVAQQHLARARQAQGGGQGAPALVTPAQQAPSPYYTGSGGRGMRLGILAPESQNLSAQLAYLPAMVQGVLVSVFSKYSGISVLDRIALDRVITETLGGVYEDNPDIVRLGHVANVGHMLTGNITRTSTGYTLQLNITDTTADAKTAAAYSGTCTVAQLDDHTAVQRAARELLVQLGIELKDTAIAELNVAAPKETIAAQTALAQGITAQKQGNNNAALDYYTQATTSDPTLREAATRFSTLADRVQGTKLAEKFDWLRAFAQTGGKYIFEITADESIPAQTLAFSGKNNISLTLRGRGANRTLNNGFTVASGVTLVLDNNITLRKGITVNSGGTLVMNNGSAITGAGVSSSGTFTMNGGTISGNYNSGVSVSSGGIFTMSGGTISGNGTSGIGNNNGGVSVNGGTFTMSGGTISGNNGGGYYSYGLSYGGGVYVKGTFTMSGGTISGNNGGGIYGNCNGGGVYVSGTFTMSGGEISGNIARGNGGGGGVYVSGTFTMRDGTINGNTSQRDGGGVYMEGGTFTMNSGTISGNTASNGGGVRAAGGTFTMSGGTISGNNVRENGGGVSVYGTFTMSNGTISGNTASNGGGGIRVAGGTFTKTGGTITGYTGDMANGNAVKNDSGAVINYKGHAVYAGSAETLLKIKEGTAGPGNNMAYDGSKSPPTASGAWDN